MSSKTVKKLTEFLKFDADAERGVALGLIVGMIAVVLFRSSDYLALNADYQLNRNPYGLLWVWLNPWFWTDMPYKIYTTAFLCGALFLQYWFFVRKGKLSKFLFYAGWLQNVVWMSGTVYQNITVTAFAPLGSLYPWLIIPFMLLQKIPLGYSFPDVTANQHWWCAFQGNDGFVSGQYVTFANGQKLILCPGGWLRWNPSYSWFWSYMMIMFWVLYPLLTYAKKKGWLHKWRIKRFLTLSFLNGGFEALEDPYWGLWAVDSDITGIPGITFLRDSWLCTFCGDWKKDSDESFWFDDRWFCEVCYWSMKEEDGPCCEAGDMCDGRCLTE